MNRVWLYSVLVAFAYGMLTLSFLCLCRCQSHFVLKLSGCLWSYTYSVLTITAYGNFAKRTMYVRFWGEGHNEAKYGQKHLRNFEGYVFTRHGHRQPFWQRHKVRQFAVSGIYLLLLLFLLRADTIVHMCVPASVAVINYTISNSITFASVTVH